MLYKTPIHVLVCKVGRKTCFVISISAVILKLLVKITYIFGSYRFLNFLTFTSPSILGDPGAVSRVERIGATKVFKYGHPRRPRGSQSGRENSILGDPGAVSRVERIGATKVTVSLHILYTANQETEGSQDRFTVY